MRIDPASANCSVDCIAVDSGGIQGTTSLSVEDNQERCLDLREIVGIDEFDDVVASAQRNFVPFGRIYAGSSFCPNYFLHCGIYHRLWAYCKEMNVKVSLSVCVFPQSYVEEGICAVRRLLSEGDGIVDELVVNDIGMLRLATSSFTSRTVLGRLFFKDSRDGRFPGFVARKTQFSLLSHRRFFEEWHPYGVEIDPISAEIDLTPLSQLVQHVAVNSPYCYMSFGNVCRAASAFKPMGRKFRPSDCCALECLKTASVHTDRLRKDSRPLFMVGKTVYHSQPSVRVIHQSGLRIRRLYFPLREFMDKLH